MLYMYSIRHNTFDKESQSRKCKFAGWARCQSAPILMLLVSPLMSKIMSLQSLAQSKYNYIKPHIEMKGLALVAHFKSCPNKENIFVILFAQYFTTYFLHSHQKDASSFAKQHRTAAVEDIKVCVNQKMMDSILTLLYITRYIFNHIIDIDLFSQPISIFTSKS